MQKNRLETQKNGELLSSILEKANISQRLCSINMGENDAFLTNKSCFIVIILYI